MVTSNTAVQCSVFLNLGSLNHGTPNCCVLKCTFCAHHRSTGFESNRNLNFNKLLWLFLQTLKFSNAWESDKEKEFWCCNCLVLIQDLALYTWRGGTRHSTDAVYSLPIYKGDDVGQLTFSVGSVYLSVKWGWQWCLEYSIVINIEKTYVLT